jgi:hypothetical protein
VFIRKPKLKEGKQVIFIIFEVIGSEGDEAFEDVESTEDGVNVSILE